MPNIDDIARWLGPKKEPVISSADIIHERVEEEKVEVKVADVAVKDMPQATVFQVRAPFSARLNLVWRRIPSRQAKENDHRI